MSFRPELNARFACTGTAFWQGLRKLSIIYRSKLSYRMIPIRPTDVVSPDSDSGGPPIFYLLCDKRETDFFFAANFRSTYPAFFLLNSEQYVTDRDLFLFRRSYRLFFPTVFAVSPNPAFQAALSQHQENHFITFCLEGKLSNQDYCYFQLVKQVHLLVVAYTKGDLPWKMTNYGWT